MSKPTTLTTIVNNNNNNVKIYMIYSMISKLLYGEKFI